MEIEKPEKGVTIITASGKEVADMMLEFLEDEENGH